MGKYQCKNKKCKVYNKVVTANTHIVYSGHTTTDKSVPCPECNIIREMVVDGYCTAMQSGNNSNLCNK